MTRRLVRRKVEHDPGDSSLLSRLYAVRGITSVADRDLSLQKLHKPETLKDLGKAAKLLATAVTEDQRILIVGDFDADGATSTALMVDALRSMGAVNVDYLIPDRFEYGYGLTPEIVDDAARFSPDLLVTVDNGMSSIDGVALARSRGTKVIVTDHHLPGAAVPEADAIVNPNQAGCKFPGKSLAGVGVAFYLLSALRRHLTQRHWFASKPPNLAGYLDLVALGTVADVVPLDRNNRILVQEGLRRIRSGHCRPGIQALLEVAGTNHMKVTSRDLAFGAAPRLNAAGRLENMSLGIECLLADNPDRARKSALKLDELNRERRAIEVEMRQQAKEHIDAGWHLIDDNPPVGLCLYHQDWHQGVVGIVASRIKDQLHRPVIAFARASDDELKGSGRSVPGMHIRDALDAIAASEPGLIDKFGGHAMAAGLSIRAENLDRFTEVFDTEARRWLSADDLEQVIVSDGEIHEDITLALVREVTEAGPWGQGFPEPLFDGQFEVLEQRIVGERHLKLKVRPVDGVQTLEAIAFYHDRLIETYRPRLAYRLDINEYRGRESVQLIVEAVDILL
ncbi:MAG: single-stranded-DNA-specific exonuclease RecJ [Pseudomonadales bacterium]